MHTELFERYLLGTLSDQEADTLKRLLKRDPAAGKQLVEFVKDATLIARVGSQIEAGERPGAAGEWQELLPATRESGALPSHRRRSLHAAQRRRKPRLGYYFAAASVLLAFGVVIVIVTSSTEPGRQGGNRRGRNTESTTAVPPAVGSPAEKVALSPATARPEEKPPGLVGLPPSDTPGRLSASRETPRISSVRRVAPRHAVEGEIAPPVQHTSPPFRQSEGAGRGESNRVLARLAQVVGHVRYRRGAQGVWAKAASGVTFLVGDRLDASRGMARIDCGGATVYVNRGALLRIEQRPGKEKNALLIALDRGEIYVADSLHEVSVETPDGHFSPVGTRFGVRRLSSRTVMVVEEGIVEARVRRRPGLGEDKRGSGGAGGDSGNSSATGPRPPEIKRIEAGYRLVVRAGKRLGTPQKVRAGRLFGWLSKLREEAGRSTRASLRDDFSSGNLKGYQVVEQVAAGDRAEWVVRDGVLRQLSDIKDKRDDRPDQLGTYLLLQSRRFADFAAAYRFQCVDNDSVGFMFRIQDENNYYRFSVDKERGFRRLVRCVKGRFTVLREDKKAGQIQQDQWYRVQVICRGPLISVSMDGRQVFQVEDSALRAGSVAFYTSSAEGAGFDDLEIHNLRSN